MNAVQKTAGGVPRRYAAVLLAIALLMVAVPTVALGRANGAPSKVHNCGEAQTDVAVVTQGGVSCRQAKQIARTWLAKKKQTSGFVCHRKKTNAGSGFQGVCVKGRRRVTIIPE
jgi:hypothetical protein